MSSKVLELILLNCTYTIYERIALLIMARFADLGKTGEVSITPAEIASFADISIGRAKMALRALEASGAIYCTEMDKRGRPVTFLIRPDGISKIGRCNDR